MLLAALSEISDLSLSYFFFCQSPEVPVFQQWLHLRDMLTWKGGALCLKGAFEKSLQRRSQSRLNFIVAISFMGCKNMWTEIWISLISGQNPLVWKKYPKKSSLKMRDSPAAAVYLAGTVCTAVVWPWGGVLTTAFHLLRPSFVSWALWGCCLLLVWAAGL